MSLSVFCLLSVLLAACAQDIDECENDPCDNGGSCTDALASFTCSCPTGYTGQTCQTAERIEMKSWTYNDERKGYIKVGCRTLLESFWNGQTTPTHLSRGIAIVVLDQDLNKISSASYDTHADSSSGTKLAAFLRTIPNHAIVLGVTADSALTHLNAAKAELNKLGVTVTNGLRHRDAVLFVAQKGVLGTKQYKVSDGKGPITKSFDIRRITSIIITAV